MRPLASLLAACAAAVLVAACGGSDDATAPAAPSTTLSGSVVKGPVTGATVSFYAVTPSGVKGALLGTATTSAGGTYSASLNYAGAILVETTGGTYVDEATGATRPLAETMRVMVTSGSEGGAITGVVTPLTTIAYSLALNGGTSASVQTYGAALNSIGAQFNLGAINLATTVPSVTGTTNTYGQALRAVSQYVANGGSLPGFLSWNSPAALNGPFAAAWQTINGGTVTFSFNNDGVTIGGTGAGGGSGTCGVGVQGSISSGGMTVPVNMSFCISGIAAGSCTSGNASISSGLSGNPALAGAANLTYTYSASCAPGATPITLN